jgi:hypothetical protein
MSGVASALRELEAGSRARIAAQEGSRCTRRLLCGIDAHKWCLSPGERGGSASVFVSYPARVYQAESTNAGERRSAVGFWVGEGLFQVGLEYLDEFVGALVGVFARVGLDDVMDEVVGHEFGHESAHSPARGGDELQDVNTFGVVVVQSAFDGVHLSTDAAQARVELASLLEHVSHGGYCTPVGI